MKQEHEEYIKSIYEENKVGDDPEAKLAFWEANEKTDINIYGVPNPSAEQKVSIYERSTLRLIRKFPQDFYFFSPRNTN